MRAARAEPLPADIWERRCAVDPTRSFLVQAPAGSGKTELLIQRFLALLGEVEEPESIIAITFTVKAAGEMRNRVLKALADASGDPPSPANDRATWELARRALTRDLERGWRIAENPARLRIQTIDALCAAIVRLMPWLARMGAPPAVTERAEHLYKEAARETMALVSGEGALADAAACVAAHLDNDFGKARSMIESLLAARDQWLRHLGAGPDPVALRAHLESALDSLVSTHLQRVASMIPSDLASAIADLSAFAARNGGPAPACAGGLPLSSGAQLPRWRAIAQLFLTKEGEWRAGVNARQGFPPEERARKSQFLIATHQLSREPGLKDALAAIASLPEPKFSDRQWETLAALLRLLPAAAAQLKLVFARRGVTDFTEIAEAARAALGPADLPTDLALALGERCRHLLIDEVQDTSVSQVSLIERLIAGWEPEDGRTLFLVGDPMQSIYRFRQAEVALFMIMRERGIGGVRPETIQLNANFRSRPELVNWVNDAFRKVLPQEDDAATSAVSFAPSTAFRESSRAGGVTIHPLFGADADAEAGRVADLVERARHSAPEGSIAVLVRARGHATAITAEFRRRGLRFRAVEQDPLSTSPAVRDLLALTHALLHRGDRAAWLAVLRARWCGLSLSDLSALAGSAPGRPVHELVAERRAGLSEDGRERIGRVWPVLEAAAALARREPLRTLVERTWRALGGPNCRADAAAFTDAARFLDLVEELEHAGGIEDLPLLDQRANDLFAAPDAEAPAALQVMTIHRAKGLEFDTVIVPGLGREPKRDDKQLVLWSEIPTASGTEYVIAPLEATGTDPDPVYRYLQDLEAKRTRNEVGRLLYVAATRARESLHLLGHVAVENGQMKTPRSGTLLELLWPVAEPAFREAFTGAPAAGGEDGDGQPRDRGVHTVRIAQGWSPPAMPMGEPTMVETAEEVSFLWAGDRLRHVGTLVHAWLCRIARDGVEAWPAERLLTMRPAIRAMAEALGVSPSDVDESVADVVRALSRCIADDRGRWILQRRQDEGVEVPLGLAGPRGVRQYVVDRTFVEPDGTRWIVDYKTSQHEGGSMREFIEHERERYSAQLNAYARAFKALEDRPTRLGLYFPLLGEWVAWEYAEVAAASG